MRAKTGRYSGYIRPFSYLIDLITINVLAYYMLADNLNSVWYHLYITISWVSIAWNIDFYEVYRYTKVTRITGKLFQQYIIFLILNFAFIGFFLKFSRPTDIIAYVSISIAIIAVFKYFIYYFLRRFRVVFGGNYRKVVILGNGKSSEQLAAFFTENPDYGYNLVKMFNLKKNKFQEIEVCCDFVLKNNIDEIYCSLSNVNNDEINQLIDFTDNNLKTLKFLPDNKTPLARNMIYDYYGYIPILSLRNAPLDKRLNKSIKRAFDIVFSALIIIGVLSWLTPIMAIFIKLESKGNVFFKQKRNGLNYKEFDCYKFRSMKPNANADLVQASKNDIRITRIGTFMRKTSIDELPQFWNVFKGDMSVVGPRPHMLIETERFAQKVNKFMVRHLIKPGITGLAQTKGYRGEVETTADITNRVKYDIFYLENWSLLLDLKIILLTVFNAIKGEKKAY